MPLRPDLGITEFSHLAAFDFSAELVRHRLHAVADPKHRDAELEYRLGSARRPAFPHGRGTAGKDHARRRELPHETVADIMRMKLAINARLAHAPCNQLRVLRAEIENQYFLVRHFRVRNSDFQALKKTR